jgi:hypothetical protein
LTKADELTETVVFDAVHRPVPAGRKISRFIAATPSVEVLADSASRRTAPSNMLAGVAALANRTAVPPPTLTVAERTELAPEIRTVG